MHDGGSAKVGNRLIGCRSSPLTKVAIQAERRTGVCNHRDTSHSSRPIALSAMADELPVAWLPE